MNLAAEFLGTALLVLLGNGVVGNVILSRTKGQVSPSQAGGFFITTVGWGLAIFVAAYCTAFLGGPAHLNPAVSIGLSALGMVARDDCVRLCLAQMTGGMFGAFLVWLLYLPHWRLTEDPRTKLAVFCNAPAVRAPASNLLVEVMATAVLMFGLLCLKVAQGTMDDGCVISLDLGAMGALPVGLLVFAIGICLGGPTGYAVNPARDLAPRMMHALLPIPGKGPSDWGYAWIPVAGSIGGALVAVAIFEAVAPVGG
ncbi:MAG: aquaporin family protein [Planctomycetes bacterium]|nr:aquaporin family protein [Planctomycetota bacterium]